MAKLEIRDLRLTYGALEILKGVSLDLREGDVVALLGQSGSGKTTLLRSIAGLETPSAGSIAVGDMVVFDSRRSVNLPPEKRGLGLVFQSYALWPHKTVFDNVAYGLRLRGTGSGDLRSSVKEVMEGIGIGHLAERFPHQLSGGQQQRVALARALVYNPPIILLDEPLSNLDAKLREEARIWIRSIIKKTGRTAVFVTHDQEEAMAVADQVVLLDQGRIVQSGTPQELYSEPRTLFASTFMGSNNLIEAPVVAVEGDQSCIEVGGQRIWACNKGAKKAGEISTVVARVETVGIGAQPGENRIRGVLDTSLYLGARWEHVFRCGGSLIRATDKKPIGEGEHWIHLPREDTWAF